jgi:hypothetical protein
VNRYLTSYLSSFVEKLSEDGERATRASQKIASLGQAFSDRGVPMGQGGWGRFGRGTMDFLIGSDPIDLMWRRNTAETVDDHIISNDNIAGAVGRGIGYAAATIAAPGIGGTAIRTVGLAPKAAAAAKTAVKASLPARLGMGTTRFVVGAIPTHAALKTMDKAIPELHTIQGASAKTNNKAHAIAAARPTTQVTLPRIKR